MAKLQLPVSKLTVNVWIFYHVWWCGLTLSNIIYKFAWPVSDYAWTPASMLGKEKG